MFGVKFSKAVGFPGLSSLILRQNPTKQRYYPIERYIIDPQIDLPTYIASLNKDKTIKILK